MVPKAEEDRIRSSFRCASKCHPEIHAYNDKHPRGRRFRPEELQLHKEQWLTPCESSAAFLARVGPIEALTDELELAPVREGTLLRRRPAERGSLLQSHDGQCSDRL